MPNRLILPLLVAILALPIGIAAAKADDNALPPSCDRACLEAVADQYMAGLLAKDPAKVPWAGHVRFSENNVMLKIGDGLWNTITGKVGPEIKLADPLQGTVGLLGGVDEGGVPSYYAMRIKVVDHKIVEVETIVNRAPPPRPGSPPPPFYTGGPATLVHYPEMTVAEPAAARVLRGRLVDIANGYFSTLQQNDGKLFAPFADDCKRNENGFESAGSPGSAFPDGDLPCGKQFEKGNYRFDSGVRDRGFMVVDEERQLVLTRMFLDHNAVVKDFLTTDGQKHESSFKTPSTLSALELFKIRDGKIFRVEAAYIQVPYHMPSVWADN